ncbi:MAG: tetratricopeptide repeat protein [Candidatus Latescibacteria bacterium]|nr:tetratricopeptide repeat protein [Candidatus Latescibacterota bacterium]
MLSLPADFLSAPRRYWVLIQGAIFAFALLLRWPWPGPQWLHVDERAFVLHPLGFWGGDFNPHFFNYPTLHFYLTSGLYYLYYLLGSESRIDFLAYHYFVDGGDLIAITRGCNSILSAATVTLVALVARRVYGAGMGVVAGVLAAVLPLSVRFAHLAITDVPAVLWLVAAVLFAVRFSQDGRRRDALLAGVLVGLAGATKYPAAIAALAVAAACLGRGRWRDLLAAGGCALAVFAAASPFALLDFDRAWADLRAMGEQHLFLESAAAPTMSSWVYYLGYGLRYGLGLLGLLATGVALLWRPSRWRPEERVVGLALAGCGGLLLIAESTFMRYAMPLAPLATLLWLRPLSGLRPVFALAAVAALAAEPLYASLQTRALLAGEDTRAEAERWLAQRAPDGAWIIDVPTRTGNISLLRPNEVYAREKRFRASYGEEELLAVYAALAARADLPPLFPSPGPGAFADQIAGVKPQGDAIVLQYTHPAIRATPDAAVDSLLRRCVWEAAFAPGGAGIYEAIDWYFAPIGNFSAVERTGPHIRAGRIRLAQVRASMPGSRFFAVLHDIARGESQVAAGGDWQGIVDRYQALWQGPLALDHFLSADYLCAYFFTFGLAAEKLGQWPRAVHLWEQALALQDDRPGLYQNLGVAYARQGRLGAAREHLQRALDLDPDYAEAHFNMGNLHYGAGELDAAEAAFTRALNADPALAGAWQGMGNVYFTRSAWEQALAAYRRALALDANLAGVAFNLAKVHLQTAAPDSAVAALALALSTAPDDVEALYLLGDLHRQGGRGAEARSLYERALSLDPQTERADAVRRLLEGR